MVARVHGELDISFVNASPVHVPCQVLVAIELVTQKDACFQDVQGGGINVNFSISWIER